MTIHSFSLLAPSSNWKKVQAVKKRAQSGRERQRKRNVRQNQKYAHEREKENSEPACRFFLHVHPVYCSLFFISPQSMHSECKYFFLSLSLSIFWASFCSSDLFIPPVLPEPPQGSSGEILKKGTSTVRRYKKTCDQAGNK